MTGRFEDWMPAHTDCPRLKKRRWIIVYVVIAATLAITVWQKIYDWFIK